MHRRPLTLPRPTKTPAPTLNPHRLPPPAKANEQTTTGRPLRRINTNFNHTQRRVTNSSKATTATVPPSKATTLQTNSRDIMALSSTVKACTMRHSSSHRGIMATNDMEVDNLTRGFAPAC